jgi:hypothetical protein
VIKCVLRLTIPDWQWPFSAELNSLVVQATSEMSEN